MDLSGAIYREIDDEHGFGSRNRYAQDGSPIRLGLYGQPEGDNIRELSGSHQQGLAGGAVRLNGPHKRKKMIANIGGQGTVREADDGYGRERWAENQGGKMGGR